MLSSSVNTNVGAMIALQNLNATNADLAETQNRINTGKKVASAKDNEPTSAPWGRSNSRSTGASLRSMWRWRRARRSPTSCSR